MGPGKWIEADSSGGSMPYLTIEQFVGPVAGSSNNFWLIFGHSKDVPLSTTPETIEDRINEQLNEEEPEFEEDSTRTKRKLFNALLHHLDLDIHTFKKHGQPLMVQAATEYKRILEELNEQRLFPPSCDTESTQFIENAAEPSKLEEGFALKPARKVTRYALSNEPNANDVLEEIDQNEGEEELTYQDDGFFHDDFDQIMETVLRNKGSLNIM
uniref:Uncharacterized protein n=1 Tax=Acrobeloides nanus TaxID=290746 RepID=A0A914CY73_9BILA